MEGKVVRCKDVGLTCDFMATSSSGYDKELLEKMSAHISSEHGIKSIPSNIQSKLEQLIEQSAK